jgi:PGF-pre-PGF domain-containing protein
MRRELLFFLLLIALPSVLADFTAFGETNFNIETCDSTTSNLTLFNQNGTNSYTIFVDGKGSELITFSTTEFTLNQGQQALIYTYYNVPCDTKPGTYPIDIILTDGELELYLTQELEITVPDSINLTAKTTSEVTTPCQETTYTLNLHNPTNSNEIYHLSSTGKNVKLSENRIVLEPNEKHEITVTFSLLDCTAFGTYPFTINVNAEKTNQQKTIELETIVKPSDIPELAKNVKTIRTDYVDSTAELTIENKGDRTTTYTLLIEGIDWAEISSESVTLKSGEIKTIQLRLSPEEDTPQGKHKLTFNAIVDETGIQYSKEITINLKPPTFAERNPVLVGGIALGILILAVILVLLIRYIRTPQFKKKYAKWKETRAKKKAQREEKRKKLLAQRVEARKRELEARAREAQRQKEQRERAEKKIERKLAKELKKDYHLIAKKDLVIGAKPKKTYKILTIIFLIILALAVFTLAAALWNNKDAVIAGFAILIVIFLAKWLSRFKVIIGKWKYVLAGQRVTLNCWKKGINSLIVIPENAVKNLMVSVRKIKTRTAPAQTVYQTIKIRANAESKFIATFSVPKKFFKHNKLEDLRLGKYTGKGWTNVSLNKAGEKKNAYFFSAELEEGTYSLYSRTKPKDNSLRNTIILAAAIIAIIAFAIFLRPAQDSPVTVGIPPQTWEAGTIHTLNLSSYFKDPDGDALAYKTTGNNHITIDFVGDMAQFTSEQGWSGEERVKFTADDGKGGIVSSNNVILRVTKPLIPSRYQGAFGIILAIIVAIFLLLMARSQKRR